MSIKTLPSLYHALLDYFGPRGWWPLLTDKPGFTDTGYHPGNYDFPRNSQEILEICCGAVLTQNTSWKNASRAVLALKQADLLDQQAIINLNQDILAEYIRSSGYYNQKAKKLKILVQFLVENRHLELDNPPSREDLLLLWGIGPETADSILLYAYQQPFFVIDAYTRRLVERFFNQPVIARGIYKQLASFFSSALKCDVVLYQEYHALIVNLAKDFCTSRPRCGDCPLNKSCFFVKGL